jgi:hypothetical protein
MSDVADHIMLIVTNSIYLTIDTCLSRLIAPREVTAHYSALRLRSEKNASSRQKRYSPLDHAAELSIDSVIPADNQSAVQGIAELGVSFRR